MPQRIMCEECGAVLYEGAGLKSPFEIISAYNGKCVNCGRRLSSMPVRVDIKTAEQVHERENNYGVKC